MISIGPLVLLASLVAMIFLYAKVPASDRTSSILGYLGAALIVGVLAYLAGAAIGIYAACSSSSSGNLCGLYGVFGIGPLLSGVAIFVYALFWRREIPKDHR